MRSHPAYKFDSVVSQEINYDLMKAVDEMYVPLSSVCCLAYHSSPFYSERGVRDVPELLPTTTSINGKPKLNGFSKSSKDISEI